jgi:hypothetical protein
MSVRPVGVELFFAGKMVEQQDEANSRFSYLHSEGT